MVVKRLVGSHRDKIPWAERRHENAAWLLSTVQNGSNDLRVLGFFGERISKGKWTLEAETSVSGKTYCVIFSVLLTFLE